MMLAIESLPVLYAERARLAYLAEHERILERREDALLAYAAIQKELATQAARYAKGYTYPHAPKPLVESKYALPTWCTFCDLLAPGLMCSKCAAIWKSKNAPVEREVPPPAERSVYGQYCPACEKLSPGQVLCQDCADRQGGAAC